MQTSSPERPNERFYQLFLQSDLLGGWTLVREWGRQGESSRMRREHFQEREQAEQAMVKVRDQQIRRGYRIVFVQGMERP